MNRWGKSGIQRRRDEGRVKRPYKRTKWGSKHIEYDGITWDSGLECGRYKELKLLQLAGEIETLRWHVPFELHCGGADWNDCKVIGKYECDFVYRVKKTGEDVYEDCKPYNKKLRKVVTEPLSLWKIKHFELEYDVVVNIVSEVRA